MNTNLESPAFSCLKLHILCQSKGRRKSLFILLVNLRSVLKKKGGSSVHEDYVVYLVNMYKSLNAWLSSGSVNLTDSSPSSRCALIKL